MEEIDAMGVGMTVGLEVITRAGLQRLDD